MQWEVSKSAPIRRGRENNYTQREHTSGDYAVRPYGRGGRYAAFFKGERITTRETTLTFCKKACEDHAKQQAGEPVIPDQPIQEFVANVPPAANVMSFKESEPLVPVPGTVKFSHVPPPSDN